MVEQANALREMSSAAHAFDELRGEVSLLRRAVEALTAERRQSPDYSRTLEALVASNAELRKWAREINARPAMRLTPQILHEEIQTVAAQLRKHDRQMLEAEHANLAKVIDEVKAILAKRRAACEQARLLKSASGVSFLAGLLLGIGLSSLVP